MRDAQKPDHISLNTLIGRLKEGRFVIPDFQREFEWRPWDIRDLMRSIFLDYYIGSLLLWKGKKENFAALSCQAIHGFEGEERPESIVLDGQQRLTAMYYAFLAPDVPLPHRASRAFYFINIEKFMAEVYDEAFGYDWLSRRWLKILGNREAQYADHIFPLSVVGAGGRDLWKWIDGYEKFWLRKASEAESSGDTAKFVAATQHAENAIAFDEHLRGITEQYQISYIELDQDLSIDKVCDIFTQINSRGIRLDIFDLMNALLKPKDLKLKKMWRDAAPRLEFVNSEKMNVYILQVMSILRQNYCSPKYLYFLLPGQEKTVRNPDGTRQKEILIADIAEFERLWNQAVSSLEAAIYVLRQPQEFGALSSDYLPYVSILPIFAALQAHVKTIPAMRRLDAQRKIRHWYWASVFNNRYSGAVESTSARDFLDLKAWIDDDAAEPPLVFEFANTFRNLDLRKETKRGTSVYNGIFNLLVLQGARDWMSGTVPQHNNLDDHHIVPASWGARNIEGGLGHTILNRTPLTAETNRQVIRDRLPNAYLPELIGASGEGTVRAILESHFISPAAFAILLRNPFGPEDFQSFISERQKTILEAIENLLIKERLDLPPQLRELDAAIEQIELSIREAIQSTLNGDISLIPSHVLVKVEERISRATKKTAALNGDYYQTLTGKLEYFDLRELQDTITNSSLWPHFQPQFVNKETFVKKFDQLGELRNGIRHSRTVDDITRKEGEASILWFKQVLGK
ncbi:MAG: GmrSD restriction endonuclease domain-containing protein [Thermodesulfobacteriota bacterium]